MGSLLVINSQIIMGNTKIKDIMPEIIIKNWIPISPESNIFQNKLTLQCLRQHTISIENINSLQQIKIRLRQTNPYVCKVLFYYQLQGNTYKLYVQYFHSKLLINNVQEWKIHKKNIVQTFIQLSKKYGCTHVCPQMIGIDSSRQIKVWINPQPSINQVWKPCISETEMITDVLNICQNIQYRSQLALRTKSSSQKFLSHISPLNQKLKMKVNNNKIKPIKLKVPSTIFDQNHKSFIEVQQIKNTLNGRSQKKKTFYTYEKNFSFKNTSNFNLSQSLKSQKIEQLKLYVSGINFQYVKSKTNLILQPQNFRSSFFNKKKPLRSYRSEGQLSKLKLQLPSQVKLKNAEEFKKQSISKQSNPVIHFQYRKHQNKMNNLFHGSEINKQPFSAKKIQGQIEQDQLKKSINSWKVQNLVDVKLIPVIQQRQSLYATVRNSIYQTKGESGYKKFQGQYKHQEDDNLLFMKSKELGLNQIQNVK